MWQHDPKVRAEFSDIENLIAYVKHDVLRDRSGRSERPFRVS